MPTQYIFMTWWFNNPAGQARPVPGVNTQPVPIGGWGAWTIAHELDNWLIGCINNRDKFVMVGDQREIQLQGNNAGTGKNQCVLGMEVVILLAAGYTARPPNPVTADETAYGGGVVVFDPPNQVVLPQAEIYDARHKNLRRSGPNGFWTTARKLAYVNIIM